MALKGTFYGTTSNDKIQPKIVWSATQTAASNYSTVTATLYYSRTNSGYTTKGTGTFSLTINGNKKSASKYMTITQNSNTVAITHTVQVTHSADGTKSITISATGSMPDTTLTSTTISSKVELDLIPRTTTPTLSKTSAYFGDSVTISTPRASNSFTHDLDYKTTGSSWRSIAKGVGTSYTWKVPEFPTETSNSTSMSVSVRCTTKNGDTTIGSKTLTMTLKVPESVSYLPAISYVKITDAATEVSNAFGAFIQGKSQLNVAITASGGLEADIKSISTVFRGNTYTGANFTTDTLYTCGSFDLVITAKDSRGRTATLTKTITVKKYSLPIINSFQAYRTNSQASADADGADLVITYDYEVPQLAAEGLDGDTATAKIEIKKSTGDTWETLWTGTALKGSGSHSTAKDTALADYKGQISTDYMYNLKLTVTDYFKASSSQVIEVPTGGVIIDIKANGKGLGFGKTAETDDLADFAWKIMARGGLGGLGENILWDARTETVPGDNMGDDDELTLSEKISDQTTGVVFAWSKYTTAKQFYDWRYFFVPKYHVLGHEGANVFMNDAYLGMRKTLYISDQSFKGYANNSGTGTINGIAYSNDNIKLMYVVGV